MQSIVKEKNVDALNNFNYYAKVKRFGCNLKDEHSARPKNESRRGIHSLFYQ